MNYARVPLSLTDGVTMVGIWLEVTWRFTVWGFVRGGFGLRMFFLDFAGG